VRAISEHARQSTSSGRPSWDQASLEWRRKVSGARWSIVLATAGPIRTKYRDSFSLPVSLPLQPVSLATLRLSAAWMRGRWWSLRHAGYQWQSRRSCRIMNLSRKQSRTTSPLKSQHERCYWLSLSFSLVLSLSLSLSLSVSRVRRLFLFLLFVLLSSSACFMEAIRLFIAGWNSLEQ